MESTYDRTILDLFEVYKTTVFNKNTEQFLTLFAPDVIIFDMWDKWSVEGLAAWSDEVHNWFESLGSERDLIEYSNMNISGTSSCALVSSFVTFTAISESGEKVRSLVNRFTWGLKRDTHQWKIIHQHSSSPIEIESLKAKLAF